MPPFDLTTKPTSLELKPGATGSLMVIVSNRTGKPVMGLVRGDLTPPAAAAWLVQPRADQLQRRYEADPAATADLEFKIQVPADAVSQDVQFKAVVRDVLAPDDTKVEGQTVAIKVTRDPVVVTGGGTKIPWWVWVIVGVVVIGAGVGIWLAVRKTGVPDVMGLSEEKAKKELTDAGYAPITVIDTLRTPTDTSAKQSDDTNTVVRQEPKAGADLPPKDSLGKTPATIVMSRVATNVPDVVNQPLALALNRLEAADLQLEGDRINGRWTGNLAQDDQVAEIAPPAPTRVPVGSRVTLYVYSFSEVRPCPFRACEVRPKPDWEAEIPRIFLERRVPGTTRDNRREP